MFFKKRTVDLSQIKPGTIVSIETMFQEDFDLNFDENHLAFVSCRMPGDKAESFYSNVNHNPRVRYVVEVLFKGGFAGTQLALGDRLMLEPQDYGFYVSPPVTRIMIDGQTVMGCSRYEAQNLSAIGLLLVLLSLAASVLGGGELFMENGQAWPALIAAGLLLVSGIALIGKHLWSWQCDDDD